LIDGQAFKANGREYIYRPCPWRKGWRAYRGYVVGERDGKRYRVRKSDVYLPVPMAETADVALGAEGNANE